MPAVVHPTGRLLFVLVNLPPTQVSHYIRKRIPGQGWQRGGNNIGAREGRNADGKKKERKRKEREGREWEGRGERSEREEVRRGERKRE